MIAFPVAWLNAAESASRRVRDWARGLLAPERELPENAEFFQLPDGTYAVIYPLPRDAGAALAAGLAELSPRSRYQRFLSSRERFTAAELNFLTNCDGSNHLALVLAILPEQHGQIVPVAVARCVRDPDDPMLAEMAVAVADRWQGRGVGKLLVGALHANAWAVGIRRWRAFLFAENLAMWRLLGQVGEIESRRYDGPGCVEAIYQLEPPPPASRAAMPAFHRVAPSSLLWIGVPATAILVTGCALWWKRSRSAPSRQV